MADKCSGMSSTKGSDGSMSDRNESACPQGKAQGFQEGETGHVEPSKSNF